MARAALRAALRMLSNIMSQSRAAETLVLVHVWRSVARAEQLRVEREKWRMEVMVGVGMLW